MVSEKAGNIKSSADISGYIMSRKLMLFNGE